MEAFFQSDLGDVRIHADESAAAAAKRLGAEAFTVGHDIYFGERKFDPATQRGKGLLGHELTHVLQQRGEQRPRTQGFTERNGDEAHEVEAEAVRTAVLDLSNIEGREALGVERYLCKYRANRPPTIAERARLEAIAAMALEACQRILQAKHPELLKEGRPLDALDVDVDLSLVGTTDRDAATVWGRCLAEAIVARAAIASAASVPALVPAVQRAEEAQPPASPTASDQLRAEARADGRAVRAIFQDNVYLSAADEAAIMAIVEKWAEKPAAGTGRMAPFDFLIAGLTSATFEVGLVVSQTTSAFDQIFHRMSAANSGRFKDLMQRRARIFNNSQAIEMVKFEVSQEDVIEAVQLSAEVIAAAGTGGGSILAQIIIWLATTLPGLYAKLKMVLDFVNAIRSIKLEDVKRVLMPRGLGELLVQALFGEVRPLPLAGDGKEEKDEEKEPESGREEKGLVKIFHVMMRLFNALKRVYNSVAGVMNQALQAINITTRDWFKPFSMVYAGIVHAVEALSDPAAVLQKAVGKVRETVSGFFGQIKAKVQATAESVKKQVAVIGDVAQLMRMLADKAVEMVVNFIITHPPSALIKTAFKVIEARADKSILQLVRENFPFADKLIQKIAESETVKSLMTPVQKPVAAVTEMTDRVAGQAGDLVSSAEAQVLGLVSDGTKMVSELTGVQAGAGGTAAAAQPAGAAEAKTEASQPAAATGGTSPLGDFLAAVKEGFHSRLLAIGTSNLIQAGKQLGRAAWEKTKAAAKELGEKVKGVLLAKSDFRVRSEDHQLWTEERDGEVEVYVASEHQRRIAEKIEAYKQEFADEEAKRIADLEELLRQVKAAAKPNSRRVQHLNNAMTAIVQELDERLVVVQNLKIATASGVDRVVFQRLIDTRNIVPEDAALLAVEYGEPGVVLAERLLTSGRDLSETMETIRKTAGDETRTGRKIEVVGKPERLKLTSERFEAGFPGANVTGKPDWAHELPMAIDFLRREGGGHFNFSGTYGMGIEGEFTPKGASTGIGISLKLFTSTRVENIFGTVFENADKIEALGRSPKSIGFYWTKVARADLLKYGVPAAEMTGLERAFDRIIFVCQDGIVEKRGTGPFA